MVWAILNPDQNIALKELIKVQNSDRVVAILGGAMLDDSLRRALELRFRKHDDMNEKIFKIGGALGNLGPKIDIAYQLYMFEKPMREALYAINEIRNLFAHQMDMKFSSPTKKMKDSIAKLVLHEGKTHYPSALEDGDTTYRLETIHQTRDLFIVNLKLALIWLMADRRKHGPWSNWPPPVYFHPPTLGDAPDP